MTDGIDRSGHGSIFVFHGPSGIGMLVSLEHEVHSVFLYDSVEHPFLDEIVALDGIEGVVEHHDFPFGFALLQLLFKPRPLAPQVEKLTVGVEQEELCVSVVHGIDHVVIDFGVEEIREHKWESPF